MLAHHLRAPGSDGGVLADPPLEHAVDMLRSNQKRFEAWDYDFQGRQFAVLRAKVRADVLALARGYHESAGIDLPAVFDPDRPFVVTGHQPELFHPGVWVKNFAVGAIAGKVGGIGLNLIVDNDIPKGASIRVPESEGDLLRTRLVPFDDWVGEAPFEDQRVGNASFFASFSRRVRESLGGQVPNPLIDRFWGHVASTPGSMVDADRVGRRFARARRLIEAEWGVRNWEIPLSALCESEGFLWFASRLLVDLERFQTVHNAALDRYRTLYHIRSKNHPVAALDRQGGWFEAPFWVWRQTEPRRRPLLVRLGAKSMDLRIEGEESAFVESLPLAKGSEACCAVEILKGLPEKGIRLRTRALTTTMFARYLVGDLFLHGIGGAKYDELGDEIAREFFGIEPPTFLSLSMTVHLGLPTRPVKPADLDVARRRLRDLTWQPERFLPADDPIVVEKRRLIAGVPLDRHARRVRYQAIRRCNRLLAPKVAQSYASAETERELIGAGLRYNETAKSREYAAVLHDEDRLRRNFDRITRTVPG